MQFWSITLHHLNSGDRSQYLLSADSDIHAYVESMFDDSMTITFYGDNDNNKEWCASNGDEWEDSDIEARLVTVESFKVAQ